MSFDLDETLLELLTSGDPKKDEPVIPLLDYPNVPRLSTGSRRLNWAFGGGFPCGALTMLWGPEGSGKSTTIYVSAADILRNPGASVAMILTEGIDITWPTHLGVDFKRVALYQPRTIEEGFAILLKLIKKNVVWAIYFDSLGMITTQLEVDSAAGDQKVAARARVIGDFFKRHTYDLEHAKRTDLTTGEREDVPPALIMTNHVTEKIGVMYGDPETMNGGKILRHAIGIWAKYGTQNKTKSTLMLDDDVVAVTQTGRITKNKFGKPFRDFEFTVRQDENGYGIDTVLEVADLAFRLGLLRNSAGAPWERGGVYFEGVQLPLTGKAPKEVDKKTRWQVEQLLYFSDEWYDRLEAAVDHAVLARAEVVEVTGEDAGEMVSV